MTLGEFNQLDEETARDALERCCVSRAWISGMLAARPFANKAALTSTANTVWNSLQETDILEAFAGHPKIGDVDSLNAKYAHSGDTAAGEQSGMASATDDVIQRLAEGNKQYEEGYGFIFIVCASGKTALEMCELLEARLHNSPEQELAIAAEEQRKILQLRLDTMA